MSTITVIRHAPTEFNTSEIFMGIMDIPLLKNTDIDVDHLRNTFITNYCTKCYTSPLKRAYDTACMIFDEESIIVDKRLIERDLGFWAGMSKKEIKSKYPLAFGKNGTMDFYYTPENGEHYECLIKRVADFLIYIHSLNSNIAVVSHNGVFRVIKSLLLGIGLSEVFSKFEPHLEPQTFTIDDTVAERIISNHFYTVDRK